MLLQDGNATSLRHGDLMLFRPDHQTVTFGRPGENKLFFDIGGGRTDDKRILDFIHSRDDMLQFAIFIGELYGLHAIRREASEGIWMYEFKKL